MLEAIGIGIVVLIWVVSSLIKGFKWLLRQTGASPAPPALTAPPPSQTMPRVLPPAVSQARPDFGIPMRPQALPPSQTLPARAPRLASPRLRQPQAGGPAVSEEATRQDFEWQERELFGAEPAALGTSLTSALVQPSAPVNSLFSSADDLVRAIILQEVLGPPLSRRISRPPTPTAPQ